MQRARKWLVFTVVVLAVSPSRPAKAQAVVTYDQTLITHTGIRTARPHTYAFTTAQNGHLDVNWWDGTSWQFSDRGLAPGGVGSNLAPAAVTFLAGGSQKVQAFVTGRNGHLFSHLWNGTQWSWSDEGAPAGVKLASSPTAISYVEGGVQQISVFVTGNDTCLYVHWWDGTQWRWFDLNRPAAAGVSSSPSATTYGVGAARRHQVFVVGDDGRLYVCWWNGAAWVWADLGAPTNVQLVSTPSALLFTRDSVRQQRVYASGDDGRLWICSWNGTSWGWSAGGAPASPVFSNPRAAVVDNLGVATGVLAVSQDGRLFANLSDGSAWQPTPVSIGVKSLIGVTSLWLRPGSYSWLALFAGADGRVVTASWEGQSWNPGDAGSPAAVSPPVPEVGHFLVSDVSPDAPVRTDHGLDTGGRMRAIVVAPRVGATGQTVYAASEMSGVWKSTDAGAHWQQSNTGLTTGRSSGTNRNLALDEQSPQRLLFAAADDDFRVTRKGGLWVTFDGAAHWQHVDLPGCADPNLGTVAFSSGRAYVLSFACNSIFTSTLLRNGTWSRLTLPSNAAGPTWHLSAHHNTLFTCTTRQVFRGTIAAGAVTWDSNVKNLSSDCFDLAALPTAASQASQVLVDQHIANNAPDVFLAEFSTSAAPLSLGFNAAQVIIHGSSTVNAISGLDGLFAVRRSGTETFDVFFGNNLQFFQTQAPITAASTSAQWIRISYTQAPESRHLIHDDTQAMAFSPTWNGTSDCLAYATSDGGISKRQSCDAWSWDQADVGLHGFKSQYVDGVARGYCGVPRRPCAAVYVPSGDNGVWYSLTGGLPLAGAPGNWSNMRGGDAGFSSADPMQTRDLFIDGTLYRSSDGSPPAAGTPGFAMYSAADKSAFIGQYNSGWPPQPPTRQILTVPGEPAVPDYLAMKRVTGSGGSYDTVVRSIIADSRGTIGVGWLDIASRAHFAASTLKAVVGAGGHLRTVIYALGQLAAPATGTLFRGTVDALTRQVARWDDRSVGCAANGVRLISPVNLIVDPYDSNVVYVSDTGDQTIKVSGDGGQCWRADRELTQLATRGGEFRFGCAGEIAGGDRFCPIQQVVFNPRDSVVRVAVTFPGGLALSRDGGVSWVSISANTINRPDAQDVTGLDDFSAQPMSVFYDPNSVGVVGRPVGGSLYVALLGRGLVRVDIPRP